MSSELRPSLLHPGAEHVFRLMERLRLAWLLKHFPPLFVHALYMFVNGFITIALLSLLAVLTGAFVFPSLGPTAYLFFFSPLADSASPKDTILGHAIGLACGYGALQFALEYGRKLRSRYLLAQNIGGGALSGVHRHLHGAAAHKPSTSRRYHSDRLSRNSVDAAKPGDH
jgi:hypothetical protein